MTVQHREPVPLEARPDAPPVLTVVIDTEEEFDWTKPFAREAVGVTNIDAQPLMHRVFERHGIVPTYVVDFPVATTPSSVALLRGLLDGGLCEIGAHLHPWVSPPFEEELTRMNSYPGNLPAELEHAKLARLGRAIGENLGVRPLVYKAGRYGIGRNTPAILEDLGYEVDTSVVPHTSFSRDGGPDFRRMPDAPYRFGHDGRLLELPLTVGFGGRLAASGSDLYRLIDGPLARRCKLPGVASRLRLLERTRLTPEGVPLARLQRLTVDMLKRGHRVFVFSYHSSTLAPGMGHYVRNQDDLKAFIDTCDAYFHFFGTVVGGAFATATEIRRRMVPARPLQCEGNQASVRPMT
ncbi:MAG: glycosyltransferase [Solirubrobacterales bacterium]